jgi:hypothetical protein
MNIWPGNLYSPGKSVETSVPLSFMFFVVDAALVAIVIFLDLWPFRRFENFSRLVVVALVNEDMSARRMGSL